tara:strand:- start:4580 stop:5095 length:516 start_codon:yes stop_codon:yes gene_type:complete
MKLGTLKRVEAFPFYKDFQKERNQTRKLSIITQNLPIFYSHPNLRFNPREQAETDYYLMNRDKVHRLIKTGVDTAYKDFQQRKVAKAIRAIQALFVELKKIVVFENFFFPEDLADILIRFRELFLKIQGHNLRSRAGPTKAMYIIQGQKRKLIDIFEECGIIWESEEPDGA